MRLKENDPTEFSIDLAIVYEYSGQWYRLIHEKTGYAIRDNYYWNEVPHSNELRRKAETLKKHGLWLDVRETYLEKKNMYLKRGDRDHPSFIIYIEAVNEVWSQNFR